MNFNHESSNQLFLPLLERVHTTGSLALLDSSNNGFNPIHSMALREECLLLAQQQQTTEDGAM